MAVKTFTQNFKREYLLLFYFLPLFLFSTHLQAEKIALFYNEAYVDIDEGSYFAEASNLKASLEAKGHLVIPFTNFTETTLLDIISQTSLIVVPELEKRGLFATLSNETKSILKNYIDCGGGLVVNGIVSSSSIQNRNAVELINGVFGFALEQSDIELTGSALLNTDAVTNTAFIDAPAEISNNRANAYLKTNSLPDDGKVIYHLKGNIEKASIISLSYGAGQVLYLGWSWWNAFPVGDLDGGWPAMFEQAIKEISCGGDLALTKPLAFNLGSDGEVIIEQADIIDYVQLECSTVRTLDIFPNHFTCDEKGEQQVLITANDECGRTIEQLVTINIVGDEEACAETLFGTVIGSITNAKGEGVEDVQFDIADPLFQKITTDARGTYQFDNFPISRNYAIKPHKDIVPLNGVSTYDIVLIQQHILGIKELDSPYKLLAADVDRSGSITIADLAEIRRLILGRVKNFSNNTSWRFMVSDQGFQNPSDPFNELLQDSYQVNLFNASGTVDFVGFKVGDVSENAASNNLMATKVRNDKLSLNFQIADKAFAKGEIVEVQFNTQNWEAILGYQFSLAFDESQLTLMEMEESNNTFTLQEEHLFFDEEASQLNVSWNQSAGVNAENGEVFTLKFMAKKSGRLSEALNIAEEAMNAEAFNESGQIMNVALAFENIDQSFQVSQNFPNPFREQTQFSFFLPKTSSVSIKVFDVTGRILKEDILDRLEAGEHTYNFHRNAFSEVSGQLFYQVEAAGEKVIKSMILVE